MTSSLSPEDFAKHVEDCFNSMGADPDYAGWDAGIHTRHARFESAVLGPPPRVTYLLTVTPELCNGLGNLHGGCATTLIDNLSTMILLGVSRPGFYGMGGVSRNLSLTYLRPVPLGTEVRIICDLVHAGRRLALIKSEIRRAEDDVLCVVSDHEKANTDTVEPSAKL